MAPKQQHDPSAASMASPEQAQPPPPTTTTTVAPRTSLDHLTVKQLGAAAHPSSSSLATTSLHGGGSSVRSGVGSSHPDDVATTQSEPSQQQHHQSNAPPVAVREQRMISRTRWALFLAYLVSLVALTVGTFRYVRNEEETRFRNEFEIFARDTIALTSRNVRNAFEALELFSTTMSTIVAHDDNMSWPQVVIPEYSAQANHVATIAGANILTVAVVVPDRDRLEFEAFMRRTVFDQIQSDLDYLQLDSNTPRVNVSQLADRIPDVISAFNLSTGETNPETRPGPYLVNWQRFPFVTARIFVKNNLLAIPTNRNAFASVQLTKRASLSFAELSVGIRGQIFQPIFLRPRKPKQRNNNNDDNNPIVGILWMNSVWSRYFQNLLPESAVGVVAVLESSCGFQSTFEINGRQATQLALEDLHDESYDHLEVSGQLFTLGPNKSATATSTATTFDDETACLDELTLRVYPSRTLENSYLTNSPWLYSGLVLIVFFVAMVLFVIYDLAVNRRQIKVMLRIHAQDRIVSDLFPQLIMTRLYEGLDNNNNLLDSGDAKSVDGDDLDGLLSVPESLTAKDNNNNNSKRKDQHNTPALADLYPEATILQADLMGFTAWSSQRAPSQVFTLLESLFVQFDKLARRYNVFKVESIADCYVAVTGVPDANLHHAVYMARFARNCLARSIVLTKKLEVKLGPDTGDLKLRIGIHSGPVTAGVLRGERARFQLFGDSVNTAGLLLKTSKGERIQISESTALLLEQAKKGEWVVKRSESITMPGKGTMQTYWLRPQPLGRRDSFQGNGMLNTNAAETMALITEDDNEDSHTGVVGEERLSLTNWAVIDASSAHCDSDDEEDILLQKNAGMSKRERLVEWHVETLSELLEQVIAARADESTTATTSPAPAGSHSSPTPSSRRASLTTIERNFGQHMTVLEEFQEIITLPKATANDILRRQQNNGIKLPPRAKDQLRHLLSVVSEMYNQNAFHNFEHASHVTASVTKMLARITDTDHSAKKTLSQVQNMETTATTDVETSAQASSPLPDPQATLMTIQDLAGHSYGITSDPLTQFAVVFSAIIHDADHPGVTNAQLVQEKSVLATRYKQKSVAEQNSVDLVWTLLINPQYDDLRACLYTNEDELRRFRQLVVNIVMATDICDKELGALRKNRWNLAFSEEAGKLVSAEDDVDRKATIVLEHLIQASDVSHTMQHWDVYLLWNERFFRECYGAYKAGRAASDPSGGWYKGEIGFFDFYVIPLAKKLKYCGVFGVSSDEYLNYALTNRKLWEENGQDMVEGYKRRFERKKRMGSLRSSLDMTGMLGDIEAGMIS